MLGLVQYRVPTGVLQPRIHLYHRHVLQCLQSSCLGLGLPLLDFLHNLVALAATVYIGLWTGLQCLAYVLNCCSTGLACLYGLLALIYHPILLTLLAKPRLQSYDLEHVLVGYALLVVGLVAMLPNVATVACLICALSACKPIYHWNDGLRGRSVIG